MPKTIYPELTPTWTPDGNYMQAGKTHGKLTLQVGGDNDVKLNSGDKVAISDLPSDWSITPDPNSNWSWTGSGKTGSLTWEGQGSFTVPARPSGASQPIWLTVTTPSGAQSEKVSVQLLTSNSKELSKPASLMFSLTPAEASLTAFAGPSAVVILSHSSALPYPNTIDCNLLALSPVSSTQLKLSFHGLDADGNSVDLSGAVDSDNLQIDAPGITFTNNEDGTWKATLPAMSKLETLDVNITGLSISPTGKSPIVLLEVRCDTGQGTASAWFTAYGPYTVGAALDANLPDYSKYLTRVGSTGPFFFYFLDATLIIDQNEVLAPLDWFILDAEGRMVFPPVAARFSLNGQDPIDEPSQTLYQAGKNTLRWVCSSRTTVAQCEIDVAHLTFEAKGPFDFSGMSLTKRDFSNWTNLAGSNFTGATFDTCKLVNTELDKSNFTDAVIKSTDLTGAKLTNCTMDGFTIKTEIFTVNKTSFKGSSFKGASFGGKDQSVGVSIIGCDLSHCNFDGASFPWVVFLNCNFDSSTFRNANFSYLNIGYNGLLLGDLKSIMTNVDCSGLTINGADISDTDVSNANFGTAEFKAITSSGLTGTPTALPSGWKLVKGSFVKG